MSEQRPPQAERNEIADQILGWVATTAPPTTSTSTRCGSRSSNPRRGGRNALVRDLSGRMFQWAPPKAVGERFREVRMSMMEPRTTWCTASLDIEYTGRENLKFDRTAEPRWTVPPSPEDYQEELRLAGSLDVLPDWLRAKFD